MKSITIFTGNQQAALARNLRNDLSIRGFPVRIEGFGSSFLGNSNDVSDKNVPIVIVPEETEQRTISLRIFEQLKSVGWKVILVDISSAYEEFSDYRDGALAVISSGSSNYDLMFEDLFRALLTKPQIAIDVRVRPSVMSQPTGVSWWHDEIYVVDERFEHVARVTVSDTAVILPGLYEPKHAYLDRRKLYVANKAANEIVFCTIEDGFANSIDVIQNISGSPLNGPHMMVSKNYLLAIADTDNHRVLVAKNIGTLHTAEWNSLTPKQPFRGPCGICIDSESVWVVDTFRHALVQFDHEGQEKSRVGCHGYTESAELCFDYPIAVERYRNYLFVVDVGNHRLVVLESERGHAPKYVGAVESGIFGTPYSLSINSDDQFAISDSKYRCIWTGEADLLIEVATSGKN